IRPRRFGGTAELPPKIEIPRQRDIYLASARFEGRKEFLARRTLIHSLSSCADRRQLVGARDAHLRLSFQDSCCRDTNVVVLLQSGADQVLELLVLKYLPPFLVSERLGRGLSRLLWHSSTISTRNVYARSPIVRPRGAARNKEHTQ